MDTEQPATSSPSVIDQVLASGGAMGARVRSHAWSATALGPIVAWPNALVTSLSICLSSPSAALIWWGPDLIVLYNDAAQALLAPLHPPAFGQPASRALGDSWAEVEPLARAAMLTGQPPAALGPALAAALAPRLDGVIVACSGSAIWDERGVSGLYWQITPVQQGSDARDADHRARSTAVGEDRTSTPLSASDFVAPVDAARVLDRVKEHYAVYDREWRYLYVNDAAASLLGHSKDQLIGARIWDLFPDSVGNAYYQALQQALTEQRDVVQEHYYAPFDRWYENRIYASPDSVTVLGADITDRKRIEQRLREREHFLQRLTETVPSVIYIYDLETGRNVYTNQRLADVLGYGPGEVQALGDHVISSLVHPEDEPAARSHIERLLRAADNEVVEHEFRVRHKTQGWRWLFGREMVFARDAAGRPTQLLGSAVDITERKQADDALGESEARFRQIAQGIDAVFYVTDLPERLVRYISPAAARLWGIEAEDLLGHQEKWTRLIVPEDQPATEAAFVALLDNGQPYDAEYRIRLPDGALRWVRDRAVVAERDAQGVVSRITGIAEDITKARMADDALRESEQRFRELAEVTPQFIWVSNAEGRLTYVNQRWMDYSGLDLASTADLDRLAPLIHADDRQALFGRWADAIAAGTAFEVEARMRGVDGALRWFLIRTVPVYDEAGQVAKWFGSSTDIQAQKETEADTRLLAELGERIRVSEDVDDILGSVTLMVGRYLRASRCFFVDIDVAADRWSVPRDYRAESSLVSLAGERPLSVYPAELRAALQVGRVVSADDTRHDPRTAAAAAVGFQPIGVRALVVVPLLRDGAWIGALAATDAKPRRWAEREVALLETVAERTWTVVEKLRLTTQLRQRDEQFRMMADHIAQFAWIADAHGSISWYNQRWFEYTGTTLDEMQGSGWHAVHHPDHLDRVVRRLQHSWDTGEPWEDTFPLRGRDGAYRWFLSRALPIRDGQGAIVRWFGTNTDVEELRLTQEELAGAVQREQSARNEVEATAGRLARLQAVTEALAVAASVADVARVVLDQGVAALGATVGWVWLLDGEDGRLRAIGSVASSAPPALAELRVGLEGSPEGDAVRSGQPIWLESRQERLQRYPASGEPMTAAAYEATASVPLLGTSGTLGIIVLGFTGPHVFAEAERTLLVTLGRQAAQALERARLFEAEQRARAEAEAAVRARDDFLSIAAHELRTPVTGLKGSAQLLMRRLSSGTLDPARLERTVQALDEAASRLAVLTNDLLDVSRIRTGGLPLVRRPVDFAALVRSTVGRIDEQVSSLHQIVVDMPPIDEPVNIDEVRIDQVLTNLLDNAVKYSPAGGTVRVTVRDGAERVTVAVVDQGIGLPAGSEAAIFAPFGRAPNAAASHLPGMGLGLFICRTIVERHGGGIAARSAGEGQGATVEFWLPCAPPDNEG